MVVSVVTGSWPPVPPRPFVLWSEDRKRTEVPTMEALRELSATGEQSTFTIARHESGCVLM